MGVHVATTCLFTVDPWDLFLYRWNWGGNKLGSHEEVIKSQNSSQKWPLVIAGRGHTGSYQTSSWRRYHGPSTCNSWVWLCFITCQWPCLLLCFFFLTYGSGRSLKQFNGGSRNTVNLKKSCKVSGITDPTNLMYWCGILRQGSQEKGEREGWRERVISAD